MSRAEAQRRAGASQPLTWLAMALPADPSRADPLVKNQSTAHHGTEAPIEARAARMLRWVSFIV
jgi:hypothetical protein